MKKKVSAVASGGALAFFSHENMENGPISTQADCASLIAGCSPRVGLLTQ